MANAILNFAHKIERMEKQEMSSDELDLGQIFAKIGDFFKSIGTAIVRFLAHLRNAPLQNKRLFIAVIVIGGAAGFSYSFFIKKKFYESSMILSSDYLNKRIVDNSVSNLNLLADEETAVGLSKALHISEALAENIREFEARPFISEREVVEIEVLKEQLKNTDATKNQAVVDQVIKRIEVENRHAFEFTVRTYSPAAIKPLQDALVNFFKNNAYIMKRIQITHANLLAKKAKLQRESNKLDSLKKVIYSNYKTMAEQSRQGSNNVILSDKAVTNPIEIYNQDLALYEQLQVIETGIFIQPDFEIVDGFTEFDEPASASKMKIIVTGMLIGFAFGYVVVAMRRLDKYLSEVNETNSKVH